MNLRIDRPLTSYGRVRRLVGNVLRNSPIQKRWLADRRLLNVGCGSNIHPGFLNLDYEWRPGLDLCWDIRKRLPFADATFDGIFSEHCLEHVQYDDCVRAIEEFHRVLKPGGTVRIVVPDGGLYIELYERSRRGDAVQFPYVDDEGLKDLATDSAIRFTPMMAVNRIFRGYGHLFAYDFETLSSLLLHAGFQSVAQCAFRQGRTESLLIDSALRAPQSLYVEGTR